MIFGFKFLKFRNFRTKMVYVFRKKRISGQSLIFALKLQLKSGAQVARKECTISKSGVRKIEKRMNC